MTNYWELTEDQILALTPDEMTRAQKHLIDDVCSLWQPVELGPFIRYEDDYLIREYLDYFDIVYAGDTAYRRVPTPRRRGTTSTRLASLRARLSSSG